MPLGGFSNGVEENQIVQFRCIRSVVYKRVKMAMSHWSRKVGLDGTRL